MLHFVIIFVIPSVVYCYRPDNDDNGDYLVSMTPKEYMKIMSCVAKCSDERTQNEYENCQTRAPKQTINALHACERKILGVDESRYYQIQAKDPEVIYEIHECVQSKTDKYSESEKEQAEEFENCCRDIYDNVCGRQRRGRRIFRIPRVTSVPRWLRIPNFPFGRN